MAQTGHSKHTYQEAGKKGKDAKISEHVGRGTQSRHATEGQRAATEENGFRSPEGYMRRPFIPAACQSYPESSAKCRSLHQIELRTIEETEPKLQSCMHLGVNLGQVT